MYVVRGYNEKGDLVAVDADRIEEIQLETSKGIIYIDACINGMLLFLGHYQNMTIAKDALAEIVNTISDNTKHEFIITHENETVTAVNTNSIAAIYIKSGTDENKQIIMRTISGFISIYQDGLSPDDAVAEYNKLIDTIWGKKSKEEKETTLTYTTEPISWFSNVSTISSK